MDNFNFFKSVLAAVPLLLLVACGKPTPRTSRHTLPCKCEHTIDGRSQVLDIADYQTEMLFEFILDRLGLAQNNFILCAAKMKTAAGMAASIRNANYVYVDLRSFEDRKDSPKVLELWKLHVLLHEIGHHLNGHPTFSYNSIEQELELNTFVGKMFYELGLTEQMVLLSYPAEKPATETHPSGVAVRAKMLEGYRKAKSLADVTVFTFLEQLNPEKI